MKQAITTIGLLVGLLVALPAHAQFDAGKLEPAKKAAAQFSTLAAGSEKTGKPPRDSDPAVKKLLDTVYDSRDFAGDKNISFQAIQSLGQRMMVGTQVAIVYMLAGTGFSDVGKAGSDPNVGDKINLNTVEFAPEMGRYFDFQLRTQSAIIGPVLVRLATGKPDELKRIQEGVDDIRAGSQGAVSGTIETLAINGLTDEWRRARMPDIVALGPKLAKFLQPAQKEQLRALALECAEVMDDPQVKKALETFAKDIGAGG